MGRANDSLIYGATTMLYVDAPDEVIESALARLPFDVHAGEFWGMPFAKIFDHFERNWFAVPDLIDSPAKILMNSLKTGHTFVGGQINREVLARSFFGL
jgi:methenyltetrahydromethanopterin cyclohydrolase